MRVRRGAAGALVLLVVGAAVAGILLSRRDHSSAAATMTTAALRPAHRARPLRRLLRLAERQIGRLESPVQDAAAASLAGRSEEHTSELQSARHLVCRLPL